MAATEGKLQDLLNDPALPSQTKQIVEALLDYLIREIDHLRGRVRYLETEAHRTTGQRPPNADGYGSWDTDIKG